MRRCADVASITSIDYPSAEREARIIMMRASRRRGNRPARAVVAAVGKS